MTTMAFNQAIGSGDPRIALAQAGSLDAFNELVREHERLVYSLCYRITGERDAAEDAAQEAFISAWRNIGRVSPDSFRPWLSRIAINASRTQMRKRRRRAETYLDVAIEHEAPAPTPEQACIERALHAEITAALSQIPEAQREAILLWHEAGFNYQEIARLTNTSYGTVKSRLFRGRKHLTQILRPEGLPVN